MATKSRAAVTRFATIGIAVVSLSVGSASCRHSRDAQQDTTPNTPAVASATSNVSASDKTPRERKANQHAPKKSGAYWGSLPRPIDQMTGDQFHEFVSTRDWYGASRKRMCKGDGCQTGAKFSELGALAIEDANEVPIEDVPALKNGVIMAYLQNFGTETDYAYEMPPGKQEWYLLWGGYGADPDVRMRLVKLTPLGNGKYSKEIGKEEPQLVKQCHKGSQYQRPKGEADMTGCAARDSLTVPAIALAFPTSGAWLSCSQGCCTSDPPVPFVHKPVKDTLHGKPGKDTGRKAPPADTTKKKP